MSDNRKLAIAFVASIVVIGIVGMLGWHYMSEAQGRLTTEMAASMGSLYAWPFSTGASLSATSIPLPTFDLVGIPKRQAELVMTRSAMGMLSTLAIFGGCVAVAYHSRRAWPTVMVAVFGWVLNGVIAAASTSKAIALVADLPKTINAPGITWREPSPGGPPFALYVLLGLFSALIWQGLAPGFAGWFAGTRLRPWAAWAKSFSTGYESGAPSAPAPAVEPAVRTCRCGAVNLPAAVNCYACGSALATEATGALETG